MSKKTKTSKGVTQEESKGWTPEAIAKLKEQFDGEEIVYDPSSKDVVDIDPIANDKEYLNRPLVFCGVKFRGTGEYNGKTTVNFLIHAYDIEKKRPILLFSSHAFCARLQAMLKEKGMPIRAMIVKTQRGKYALAPVTKG